MVGPPKSPTFSVRAEGDPVLLFDAFDAPSNLWLVVITSSITTARYAHEHLPLDRLER